MKSVCFHLSLRILRENIGLSLKPFLILRMLLAVKQSIVGFKKLAEDPRYSSGPDTLCPGPILLEVKTHAENCSGPLDNLVGKGHHVLQPNLQMMCTGYKVLHFGVIPSRVYVGQLFPVLKKDKLLCSISRLDLSMKNI